MSGFVRAGVWNGPSFAASARVLFQANVKGQPLGAVYSDVAAAFRLLFSVDWSLGGFPNVTRERLQSTAVLHRKNQDGTQALDKVVLRGDGSNVSILASDLYGAEIRASPCSRKSARPS